MLEIFSKILGGGYWKVCVIGFLKIGIVKEFVFMIGVGVWVIDGYIF